MSRKPVRTRLWFPLLALTASFSVHALDSLAWHEDLDYVVDQLITRHADPWDRVHEPEFRQAVETLRGRIHELDDGEVTVEMMGLVALFNDGHTKLMPTGPNGFVNWYPIRLHRFSDGIYVTSSQVDPEALRGARVTTINGRLAESVMDEVTALFGADNRFGRKAFAFLADFSRVSEWDPGVARARRNRSRHLLDLRTATVFEYYQYRTYRTHASDPGCSVAQVTRARACRSDSDSELEYGGTEFS